jgi:hypothetical protein
MGKKEKRMKDTAPMNKTRWKIIMTPIDKITKGLKSEEYYKRQVTMIQEMANWFKKWRKEKNE